MSSKGILFHVTPQPCLQLCFWIIFPCWASKLRAQHWKIITFPWGSQGLYYCPPPIGLGRVIVPPFRSCLRVGVISLWFPEALLRWGWPFKMRVYYKFRKDTRGMNTEYPEPRDRIWGNTGVSVSQACLMRESPGVLGWVCAWISLPFF